MKRTEIIRKLVKAGFTIKEGANHTKIYKDGAFKSVVGRHKEISPDKVKQIEDQTGIKL